MKTPQTPTSPPPSVIELSHEQIEYIRKRLIKRFKYMDEYIEIALTEASTATDTKRGSDTVGFVYIIAKNNILDELKRLKKFKKLESNAGAPTAKELMVDSPELTILGDIAEQEMLATLTQKQRTVALLREDGYSIDEIAEKEQISYDAVNERLKAIRRKFKKYL